MAWFHNSGRAQLFVGRLDKEVRTKELEDIFSRYGKLLRCDIKYGATFCYAFVDYEDRRDAEDAIRYENGRELHGSAICVEWAKGPNYRYDPRKEDDGYRRSSRRDDDRRRRRSRSRSRSGSYKRRSRSTSRSRRRRTRSPRSRSTSRPKNGRAKSTSRSHSRSKSP